MTRGLDKIDWSRVLFLDIETASAQPELKKDDDIYPTVEWKFRNMDTGEVKPFKEVVADYKREAGLHPALCKIVCISVGYIYKEKIRILNITEKEEGDEAGVIAKFYQVANGRTLAGHNIKRFDVPMIRMRALANGLNVPMSMNEVGLKPWEIGVEKGAVIKWIDSMDLMRGTFNRNISVGECAHLVGIPTPKSDINGSQVGECYWAGELDRIASYCGRDVVTSANIILALAGITPLELDEDHGEIREASLADKIFEAKEISEESKRELRELLSKTKLTKKDKSNLAEMLEALIIYTPFMQKGDSKDDVAYKKRVVSEFIKTI